MLATLTPPAPPAWDHTPAQILSTTKDYIERLVRFNDELALIETPTVANVLIPYGDFANANYEFESRIPFYQYVLEDAALRDAGQEASRLINEADIEQSLRVDLYEVFKRLADSNPTDFPNAEAKRLLEKVILGFERNGLHLSEAKRAELKAHQSKLNELLLVFSKNSNEEDGFVSFTLEELEGVPELVVNQFEVDDDGLYKVLFKYPDIFPVLKFARREATRKRAFVQDANKLTQNGPLLEQLVRTRFHMAHTLGYDNFSKYVLEDRLAKTERRVVDFLEDLKRRLTPLALEELAKLKALKGDKDFYIWDQRFYDNLMLEREYQVNTTKISEYFPLQSTIEKMFGFYERIFDVKFVEEPKVRAWHPDVKQFAVYQNITRNTAQGEQFLGWLYLDLHPRKGKYGHAANFGLTPGYVDKQGHQVRPVTALVCNFSKPTKSAPSLLKHDEVVTFFHELGHGMHDLLSFTCYARFHGTNVPRDFVEAPSQSFEYWTWSKDEIKALSSHYQTGEPIPDVLVDQLVKSKNVNGALFNLRQLHFALFDMKLHTISSEDELAQLDLLKLWNDLREQVCHISNGGTLTYGYGSFGHIAGGYESGYYGYLFSKVYADDIYYSIFKGDPLNVENGIRYRDKVLAKGNSRDVLDGVVELLGREPNLDAFLKELGVNDD